MMAGVLLDEWQIVLLGCKFMNTRRELNGQIFKVKPLLVLGLVFGV